MIQDYGFRLYNPAIAKFLSVDPLSSSYPMLTPYQFASNRPIDGIDLDGLEWNYAEVDQGGTTKIEITVEARLRLTPEAIGLIGTDFSLYEQAIDKQLNESFLLSSDGKFSSSFKFGKGSNNLATPTITVAAKKLSPEGVSVSANTTGWGIEGNIYNKDNTIKTPEQYAEDIVHELFHTLRLGHPTDGNAFPDTELIKLTANGKGTNSFLTTPNTSPNINQNIMIYSLYTIDGVYLGDERETKPGILLTNDQLMYIPEEIDRQKQGKGRDVLDMYWYEPEMKAKPLKTKEIKE